MKAATLGDHPSIHGDFTTYGRFVPSGLTTHAWQIHTWLYTRGKQALDKKTNSWQLPCIKPQTRKQIHGNCNELDKKINSWQLPWIRQENKFMPIAMNSRQGGPCCLSLLCRVSASQPTLWTAFSEGRFRRKTKYLKRQASLERHAHRHVPQTCSSLVST